MTVHCRIMKIDIEKFSVDLTCRTSDLMDKANEWKLPKDSYYDFDTETEDQKQEEELKKKQQRTRECNNGITEIIRIAWCTAILTGIPIIYFHVTVLIIFACSLHSPFLSSIYKACDRPPQLPQYQFQPGGEDDGDPGPG